MSADATDAALRDARRERLVHLLGQLAEQGLTQRRIAADLGLPPNYISDVKNGYREMQQWLADSIGRAYGVSPHWLLTGEGDVQQVKIGAATSKPVTFLLPILTAPVVGEPREAPDWDGAVVELSGRAAAAAGAATRPYVLRVAADDPNGRIRSGDLLLLSQSAAELPPRAYVIVRHRGRLQLAHAAQRGLISITTGRTLGAASEIVARCVGIVWASL